MNDLEDLQILLEELIYKAPSFPGDLELARKIGQKVANLRERLRGTP